jgi:hypothetical protein
MSGQYGFAYITPAITMADATDEQSKEVITDCDESLRNIHEGMVAVSVLMVAVDEGDVDLSVRREAASLLGFLAALAREIHHLSDFASPDARAMLAKERTARNRTGPRAVG